MFFVMTATCDCLQSVYGVLSCMEGCDSFDDVMTNTSLKRWYDCTKGEIRRNNGAREIAN